MHKLGIELVRLGHKLTVITGYPNYPHGKVYPGYRQKLWQREEVEDIRVLRLPLFPDHSRSVVKRTLNYLSFSISASLLGPLVCGPADLMFVQLPPVSLMLPTFLISLLRRIPFVLNMQDMWPETLPATGMVRNSLILDTVNLVARLLYKHASAITVISDGFKKNLVAKGISSQKIYVLPNWAYEEICQPTDSDNYLDKQSAMLGRFNVVYAGNIGPAQGLDNVIEAASMLIDLPAVQFVLIGDGLDKERLENIVKLKRFNNVLFFPRQPMSIMSFIYTLADVLLIHLTDDPLFEITIPGKTQSCLLGGKPIIASVNGDTADLIVDAGAGLTVPAMNPNELNQAVRKLYAMPPQEREAMGSRGRDYYLKNLSPEVQVKKYEQLFKEIIKGRN